MVCRRPFKSEAGSVSGFVEHIGVSSGQVGCRCALRCSLCGISADLLPDLPSVIRRFCSGFGPRWAGCKFGWREPVEARVRSVGAVFRGRCSGKVWRSARLRVNPPTVVLAELAQAIAAAAFTSRGVGFQLLECQRQLSLAVQESLKRDPHAGDKNAKSAGFCCCSSRQ